MSDAFGTGEFKSEAGLDRSRMLQRKRKMVGDAIDLREDERSASETVRLVGGPYDGKCAVVNKRQHEAFVIGDYTYAACDGAWRWSYDAYA